MTTTGRKDEPRPIGIVLIASVVVIAVLIVIGLRMQDAAISSPVAPPPSTATRPAWATAARQTETSVNVPRVESDAKASDRGCRKALATTNNRVEAPSVCREVVVTDIPAGSRIRAVKPYVKEEGTADWRPCQPVGEGVFMSCGIEAFVFASVAPAIASEPSGMTVTWMAVNSSRERSRDAQVVVEYEPPVSSAK